MLFFMIEKKNVLKYAFVVILAWLKHYLHIKAVYHINSNQKTILTKHEHNLFDWEIPQTTEMLFSFLIFVLI